jgi:hypothetical protein
MAKELFAQTLRKTRAELERLRLRRSRLDSEIAKLEQIEIALGGVTEPGQQVAQLSSSITNAVRSALKTAVQPIAPTEVRDKMVAMGFDSGPYSQFLASVHVVLKRLAKKQEVFEFTFGDCKKYWWVKKSMPGGALPENGMLGKYYNTRRPEDLQTSMSYEESRAKEVAKYRR